MRCTRHLALFLPALLFVLAALAAGCGSTETVTVTEEADAPAPETVVEETPAEPKEKKKRQVTDQSTADGQEGGDTAVVPNLVGVDHQLAQDTLQAEGFYFIEERDCSGADRLLLWDRNWVVVEQDPPAGTKASLDASVALCSVKDGE